MGKKENYDKIYSAFSRQTYGNAKFSRFEHFKKDNN